MFLFFHFFAITLISHGNGAAFSAIAKMNSLLEIEAMMIKIIEKHVRIQEQELGTLKNIVELYESEYQKASPNPQDYLSNPLNAYLILKHLTIDWKKAKTLITKNSKKSISKETAKMEKRTDFPTKNDLSGAVEALVRLQETYDLDVPEISKGFLDGVKNDHRLSVDDCFNVGKVSFENKDYNQTVLWMREALNLAGKETQSSVLKTEIAQYIVISFNMQGNVSSTLDWSNKLLRYSPRNVKASIYKMFYEGKMIENSTEEIPEDLPTDLEDGICDIHEIDLDDSYKKLCRGEILMRSETEKQLKCRYANHNDPFLKLAPFKEEEASLKPRILIYHDVIGNEEIASFQKSAMERFEESTVRIGQVSFDVRLSNTGWLTRNLEHVETVTKRMERMTKLSCNSAEHLQIANYGIGGFYVPHFDFFSFFENYEWPGNRIATVIFYMSDVEQGGATVFPFLNITIRPRKGSAVFWYNLEPTGRGNTLTLHAACPVLKGSKWVANKWLREAGQPLSCVDDKSSALQTR